MFIAAAENCQRPPACRRDLAADLVSKKWGRRQTSAARRQSLVDHAPWW
jgi:hypothetical protein